MRVLESVAWGLAQRLSFLFIVFRNTIMSLAFFLSSIDLNCICKSLVQFFLSHPSGGTMVPYATTSPYVLCLAT